MGHGINLYRLIDTAMMRWRDDPRRSQIEKHRTLIRWAHLSRTPRDRLMLLNYAAQIRRNLSA